MSVRAALSIIVFGALCVFSDGASADQAKARASYTSARQPVPYRLWPAAIPLRLDVRMGAALSVLPAL